MKAVGESISKGGKVFSNERHFFSPFIVVDSQKLFDISVAHIKTLGIQ